MNELRDEVQEFQERWNSMVLDITEDGVITCDEAQAVHGWIASERDAYTTLKAQIEDRQSNSALLHPIDELLRKAEAMDARMMHIIAQCEGSDER
ncbi:MAG: hypothetical protein GC204_01700 [Chloroflexi bacterium]|nr:hypothetical protein [Chloroflexota bacterium]